MRYFVTLNDREFPLRLERESGPLRLCSGSSGGEPLECELLSPARQGRPALVRVQGRVIRVGLEAPPGQQGSSSARPRAVNARINGELLRVRLETELERRARPTSGAARASGTRVVAPMPGRVVKVNVSVGDLVALGAPLLSVEAMKMENELQAPAAGRVLRVHVQAGTTVESDQELVVIAPSRETSVASHK